MADYNQYVKLDFEFALLLHLTSVFNFFLK